MIRLLLPLAAAGLMICAQLAPAQAQVSASTAKKTPAVAKKAPAKRAPLYDPTDGDNVDGEDLVVRRAAVAALGSTRGSVVVADPNTGRIFTMVNQKLGLLSGFTPCSTIKLVTSLAALNEHVVERDTVIHLGRYTSFTLTTAIAHSNNEYFATLGSRLGYERVMHYAQLLGLGEKAGWEIPGEHPGSIAPAPPKVGGMG
jgi:penicillin-binding protein 2